MTAASGEVNFVPGVQVPWWKVNYSEWSVPEVNIWPGDNRGEGPRSVTRYFLGLQASYVRFFALTGTKR